MHSTNGQTVAFLRTSLKWQRQCRRARRAVSVILLLGGRWSEAPQYLDKKYAVTVTTHASMNPPDIIVRGSAFLSNLNSPIYTQMRCSKQMMLKA